MLPAGPNEGLRRPYEVLARREPVFAPLIELYGRPDPFEWHDGGRTGSSLFAAMVLHITGQRISALAAFTVYDRIAAASGEAVPTAASIAAFGVDALRGCGLSAIKAGYVWSLAKAETDGTIDLEHLGGLDDARVIAVLTALPGVGLWTAQTFLIHNLRRPDVLPADDLGIRRAVQKAWGFGRVPSAGEVERQGVPWAPWRSYAAALLWRSLRPPSQLSDPKARALARLAHRDQRS